MDAQLSDAIERLRRFEGSIDDTDSLLLYGLYKRIHVGECYLPEPWHCQTMEHARWRAWFDRNGLQRAEAVKMYIEKVNEITG